MNTKEKLNFRDHQNHGAIRAGVVVAVCGRLSTDQYQRLPSLLAQLQLVLLRLPDLCTRCEATPTRAYNTTGIHHNLSSPSIPTSQCLFTYWTEIGILRKRKVHHSQEATHTSMFSITITCAYWFYQFWYMLVVPVIPPGGRGGFAMRRRSQLM